VVVVALGTLKDQPLLLAVMVGLVLSLSNIQTASLSQSAVG
jgi:hypothetical protein